MRIWVSIVLLLVFSAQQSSRLLVWIDYTVNQSYIANTLCENKAKPQLRCKGKCYLKKQLAKAETPDATNGHEKSAREFQEVIYVSTTGSYSFDGLIHLLSVAELTPTLPSDLLSAGFTNQPFQPPRA